MTVIVILEGVILLVLCVLVVGLLRAYATVLKRLHQLDGGAAITSAPPFRTIDDIQPPTAQGLELSETRTAVAADVAGMTLDGEVVAMRTTNVDHDTVLVFLSSGCAGCTGFWEDFAHRREPTGARVLIITKSAEDESVSLLRELAPPTTDLIMSTQAWTDYDIPGSPYVVVVDGPTGRIKGEGSGTSLTQVSGLIRQAFGDSAAMAKPRKDAQRETDADRALLAAGIGPGHPSLYATEANELEPR